MGTTVANTDLGSEGIFLNELIMRKANRFMKFYLVHFSNFYCSSGLAPAQCRDGHDFRQGSNEILDLWGVRVSLHLAVPVVCLHMHRAGLGTSYHSVKTVIMQWWQQRVFPASQHICLLQHCITAQLHLYRKDYFMHEWKLLFNLSLTYVFASSFSVCLLQSSMGAAWQCWAALALTGCYSHYLIILSLIIACSVL